MKITTEVNGQFVSHGLNMIYSDAASVNFNKNHFFGIGFIVNYEEIESNDTSTVFEAVSVESKQPDFGDTNYKYLLSK